MASHTFNTTSNIEEMWKKYEKENPDVIFSKTANNALLEYLKKRL